MSGTEADVMIVLAQTMEVCNFACHVILRWLRPASDPKKRQIPEGFAFNKISCPNYFFESLSWLAFTALTMDPFGERVKPLLSDPDAETCLGKRRGDAEQIKLIHMLLPDSCNLLGSGDCADDGVGQAEAQEIQEGVWR